jgi:arginyl-tRNA synthetase
MDLLTTAINKAKKLLQERNQDLPVQELDIAAKCLGTNAIKYADLSNNRTNNYAFSYDKMLQFEGNTAAFLSYAYVRIKSIQRKASINMQDLIANTQIQLQDPTEIELALHACKFADAINATVKDLLPNRLTDYLFNLAEKFHSFFHQCKVTGSLEQNSRLLLCEVVLQILHRGFNLLGLVPLEKM